jgi:hypothetical protein
MESKASTTALPAKAGLRELRLSLDPQTDFESFTKILKEVLVIPDLPGIRGCRPCLSGLDRLIIEDPAMRGIR